MIRTRSARGSSKPGDPAIRRTQSTRPTVRASILAQTDVVKIEELQFGRELGKVSPNVTEKYST